MSSLESREVVHATSTWGVPPVQPLGAVADDIDYEIKGLQFPEIELDPGESAVAESGAMVGA